MAWSCDRIVAGLRGGGLPVDVVHLVAAASRPHEREVVGGWELVVPLTPDPDHALRRAVADLERRAAARTPLDRWTHLVAFGGTHPVLVAPTWASWLDLPLVTLLRGNDLDTAVHSVRRRRPLLDALEASRAVGVVCHDHERRVRALCPGAAITLVPNGIDATHWHPSPSELAAATRWRADQVPPGRITIGLIGHLKAKKGVDWFLDRLTESGLGDRVHLLLVGERDPAVDAALERADGPTSTTLPFRDREQLLSVLPACDLVALPSFYDGLPNVALESAALGIPLLCSDAGGLADLVDDGITGYRFRAGDDLDALDALDRAVHATHDERRRLGAQARSVVVERFSAAAEIAGYRSLLARVGPARDVR